MKRLAVSVLLSALILSMFGCSDVSQDSITENTPLAPQENGERLEQDYFELLDELDYEGMSGTYYPEQPGFFVASAESWPGHPTFSIMIPEGACTEPVDFTMHWPTYESYLERGEELADFHQGVEPLIIRFGPDGQQFNVPLTIRAHWMTWCDLPAEMQAFYVYPELAWAGIGFDDVGGVVIEPLGRSYRIEFKVDHFSDWETGPLPGPRPPEPN